MSPALSLAIPWAMGAGFGLVVVSFARWRARRGSALGTAAWLVVLAAGAVLGVAVWNQLPWWRHHLDQVQGFVLANGERFPRPPDWLPSWSVFRFLQGFLEPTEWRLSGTGATPLYLSSAVDWLPQAYLLAPVVAGMFLLYLLGAEQLPRLRWVAVRLAALALALAAAAVLLHGYLSFAAAQVCTPARCWERHLRAVRLVGTWVQLAPLLLGTPVLAWWSRALAVRRAPARRLRGHRVWLVTAALFALGCGLNEVWTAQTRLVPGRPVAVDLVEYTAQHSVLLRSEVTSQVETLALARSLDRLQAGTFSCGFFLPNSLVLTFRYAERTPVRVEMPSCDEFARLTPGGRLVDRHGSSTSVQTALADLFGIQVPGGS